MRRSWMLLVGVGMLLSVTALAQDYGKEKTQDPADDRMEERAAWEKAGTPNENHRRLDYMIGTWNCSLKMWQGEGSSPTESAGKSTSAWILDGRYVETKYEGNVLGEPYEGRGINGYDNINKRYFSMWLASNSTGGQIDAGQYNATTRTFTYAGKMNTPMGKAMFTKMDVKIIDSDTHALTMYHGESKSEMKKFMEITYRRAAGGAAADAVGSATVRLVARTVEAGCGKCTYGMSGVSGCKLAVKIDGKSYLVKGAKVNAHNAGLCSSTKNAEITGSIEGDKFVATSFTLEK